MSKTRRIPSYCLHKPSGQARVRINGKDHYLGKHGSPESHEAYDELLAEYIDTAPKTAKTLTAILAGWWSECKKRYSGKGKGKHGNAVCWRPVIKMLRESYGDQKAESLGPVLLRNLIETQAKQNDWSLTYARMVLTRVRYIFKWAVAEELVSLSAYQKLETIELRHGRKTDPIPPVDVKLLAKTLRLLPKKIADMARIQRLTGCRPGELVSMRPEEIARSKDVWIYTPHHHKTQHKGKSRTIFIGPRAQALIAPWIIRAGDGYVFPSKANRCYTSDSYRRAIQRICESHGLEIWSPNQLRKSAATRIRSALDVESAASILGHSSSTVTGNFYAQADTQRAVEAARKLG